jgi:hypothetical protein
MRHLADLLDQRVRLELPAGSRRQPQPSGRGGIAPLQERPSAHRHHGIFAAAAPPQVVDPFGDLGAHGDLAPPARRRDLRDVATKLGGVDSARRHPGGEPLVAEHPTRDQAQPRWHELELGLTGALQIAAVSEHARVANDRPQRDVADAAEHALGVVVGKAVRQIELLERPGLDLAHQPQRRRQRAMLAIDGQIGEQAGAQRSPGHADLAHADAGRAAKSRRRLRGGRDRERAAGRGVRALRLAGLGLADLRLDRLEQEHHLRSQRRALIEPGELARRGLLEGEVAQPELLHGLPHAEGQTSPNHVRLHGSSR